MRAFWMIPAGLSGVGIGLAWAWQKEQEAAERAATPMNIYVNSMPDPNELRETMDRALRKIPQHDHRHFRCQWCNNMTELDEIHGVMKDHGGPGERFRELCPGSGKAPHL